MSQKSLAAKIDPLAKLLWIFLVSALSAALHDPLHSLALLIMICLSFTLCSRSEIYRAFDYWKIILFLPILLLFFHLAVLPLSAGDALASEDIVRGGILRSAAILNSVVALIFFLITTEIRSLVDRFVNIGMPLGVAFSIYLMLRFLEIISNDARNVRDALVLRAGGNKLSLSYLRLFFSRYIGIIVILTLRRTDQVAMAMDLRGFASGHRRTYLGHQEWRLAGWLLPIGFIIGGISISLIL